MKKIISVLLAVLMIFSVSSVMFASAAEGDTYVIKFLDSDGTLIAERTVVEGGAVIAPANPTKEKTETTEYTFKGWNNGSGVLYHSSTVPAATGDATYVAVYAETDITGSITFMQLVRSIFARINAIFEYFYRLFIRETPANP